MNKAAPVHPRPVLAHEEIYDGAAEVSLADLFTWLGQGKYWIGGITVLVALASLALSFTLTPIFTARTSVLPPASQQQGALSSLLSSADALGIIAGGLGVKTPEELYVQLMQSDAVMRALDARLHLQEHYKIQNFESLRRGLPLIAKVSADKKSGIIKIEVDDEDPQFAADLANAHVEEVMKLLAKLSVNDAQRRRAFFDGQLQGVKESLVKAEENLQRIQERTGVVVLDRQAESLISQVARLKSQIGEREVQLRVLRTNSTDANREVIRIKAERQALLHELDRLGASVGDTPTSTASESMGRLPQASVDYARAMREVTLQEGLLQEMTRQFELAKFDEAKDGPTLQQVDKAIAPDWKSKPSKAALIVVSTVMAFFGSAIWIVFRRAREGQSDPKRIASRRALSDAWRLRR